MGYARQIHHRITCEYIPLVSNYSRAVLDLHCCMCKYLYLHSNTHAFLMYSRTSQELSVKFVKARRKAQVFFYKFLANSPFQAFGNTNWQMNRLVKRLLIVSTNSNCFSLANHNLNDSINLQIFLPAKLSHYMVYRFCVSEAEEKMMGWLIWSIIPHMAFCVKQLEFLSTLLINCLYWCLSIQHVSSI